MDIVAESHSFFVRVPVEKTHRLQKKLLHIFPPATNVRIGIKPDMDTTTFNIVVPQASPMSADEVRGILHGLRI